MTPALHGALQVGRGLGHISFRHYFRPNLCPHLPPAILLPYHRHALFPFAEILPSTPQSSRQMAMPQYPSSRPTRTGYTYLSEELDRRLKLLVIV